MKKKQLNKIVPDLSYQEEAATPKNLKYQTRWFNLIALVVICLLGFIIYSNSFDCSFHYDDTTSIVNNLKIRDISDIESLLNHSQTRIVAYYSFAFNYHFHKLDVWGYHMVNLIIHLITSCLVWWITVMIFSSPVLKDQKFAKHKKVIAFITALMFVSHPLATQSVTYIVQRMASMVAIFYFLSILFYLKARLAEIGNVLKILCFAGCIVSALLAMFTKENAYTLPFAIVLVELFFVRTQKLAINFRDYRVLLIIAGLIGFIIYLSLKFSFDIFNPIKASGNYANYLTPSNYLFTQFSVIVKYLQLLLIPLNQMLDYDFPVSDNFFEIRTLLSFTFLIGLIILSILLFKKYRIITFGILFFLLALSIESSIIPINDVIFEHRTYLPSFGFFLILSSSIFILFGEKYKFLAISFFVVLIGINSFLAYERNKVWKTELSLWNDNVIKAPNLTRPITNRGFAYRNLGQWDKALSDYTRALEINPDYIVALSNRGVAYAHFKQWDKALIDYTKAIKLNPNFKDAYSNRGAALSSLNQWEKAILDYSKAIEIDSNYFDAYYNRGIAYGNLSQWNKALDNYNKAISINPKYTLAYYNRAIAYGNLKDWNKAIEEYSSAIKMDPNFDDGYYNRGNAYNVNGQIENAISDYTSAISINPKHVKAHYNRAIAYASLKDFNKSIEDYSSVIRIEPQHKYAYVNRGNVFGKLEEWSKAIDDYSKALDIDPHFSLAYRNLEIAKKKVKIK